MTTLSEYMERHGISDDAMAQRLGCSRTRVSKIRRRGERPSLKLALAIERETGGEVRPIQDLIVAASMAPPKVSDPDALAAIFDTLGGHEVIAEGAKIAVTVLEQMESQGSVWPQYRDALVAFARRQGFVLDADKVTLTPRGREAGRAA